MDEPKKRVVSKIDIRFLFLKEQEILSTISRGELSELLYQAMIMYANGICNNPTKLNKRNLNVALAIAESVKTTRIYTKQAEDRIRNGRYSA
jgi:hypothetical protein